MREALKIDCGPADDSGRRLVIATYRGQEHRDRFHTDDAFRRQQFQNAVIARLGLHPTDPVVAELDSHLLGAADAEDVRQNLPRVAADSVCLADVKSSAVFWLWPGRIALGKVTLIAGDPGLGKSMVTLDIAARVSRGAAWPDEGSGFGVQGSESDPEPRTLNPSSASPPNPQSNSGSGQPPSLVDQLRTIQGLELSAVPAPPPITPPGPHPPGGVILLSAEDDLADTIRPRLEAHGANCQRIVAIKAIAGRDADGVYRRSFNLGQDLVHLSATIDQMRDCRLVVIDPISAYLGRAGENFNAEVRALLGPLATLAAERNLAIVAVTHLRKEEGAAIYRTMGSLAFVAAARAAWMICKDPREPLRRLLLPVKNNLAGDAGGLAYTIEPRGPNDAPIVCWSDEPVEAAAIGNTSPRPLRGPGRPDSGREDVRRWLKQALEDGPRAIGELRKEAESRGISYGTLRRAFDDLDGEADRQGFGLDAKWHWRLPKPAAHNSET